ncbi:class Ib ribonucleoside-diphosphate reductase assembly flavoprotein NrdI [Salinicoccus halodurans]|uniref:Protein involved in ribonucleotide reduction n=1 Tax=Salinicoccus halodurans TaxID=407035 RepID=A0A0F7HI59_9STAP|nr:class Ib ribonucleoside-diphosphate reductase assembly flavoprotein NrdI [Salinicoccus halodurans]AKG73189.1 ribonucleotide reductase stimulatory protein [Salinicoccus halodurans]SFK84242.1 protein involved in ribonucleotide reduction [Salinicoccus halodurans]
MLIAFYSMTGNVRRFVKNSGIGEHFEVHEIKSGNKNEPVNKPFILVTSTYGYGGVPAEVESFLGVNHRRMLAVASSGNRNWGAHYAMAGEHISNEYSVPLLLKFELHGTPGDREEFIEKAGAIHESIRREEIQSH